MHLSLMEVSPFKMFNMLHNPFSLHGKTILITGASSGIGKSTAIECSKLGANVIVTGRDQERLKMTFEQLDREVGQNHGYIVADLTEKEGLDRVVDCLTEVSGVVLCAGKGLHLPVQFSSREHMDEFFNVNYFSPVELIRILYKKKKLEKGASIVAISSLGGTQIFRGRNSIYGASKAALSSFMKFCAIEFSVRKVRVNCVCPGMIDTPFIHRDTVTEEQLQNDAERYPLKRYGKPEDVAYMIIYLLSDAASWVTGQDFVVDGGISIS